MVSVFRQCFHCLTHSQHSMERHLGEMASSAWMLWLPHGHLRRPCLGSEGGLVLIITPPQGLTLASGSPPPSLTILLALLLSIVCKHPLAICCMSWRHGFRLWKMLLSLDFKATEFQQLWFRTLRWNVYLFSPWVGLVWDGSLQSGGQHWTVNSTLLQMMLLCVLGYQARLKFAC